MSVTAACLCLKMRMASRTMTIFYDGVLQSTDLTSSQFSVLRNIHRFAPRGVSELANVMLLERTTLTRNMAVLEERGLARLAADESDGRTRRPVLTDAGVERLHAALPNWRMAQQRILGGLGQDGWSELLLALRNTAAVNEQAPERMYEFSDGPAAWEIGGSGQDLDVELDERQRCVNSTMRGASRFITSAYDADLRSRDLKITQFHVLAAIGENENLRITDLANLLSLDQATSTIAVSGLRRRGWVEEPEKGRPAQGSRSLALTRSGASLLEEAIVDWKSCQDARAASLGDHASRWGAALDRMLSVALEAKRA